VSGMSFRGRTYGIDQPTRSSRYSPPWDERMPKFGKLSEEITMLWVQASGSFASTSS
jgi:hypothetical protein